MNTRITEQELLRRTDQPHSVNFAVHHFRPTNGAEIAAELSDMLTLTGARKPPRQTRLQMASVNGFVAKRRTHGALSKPGVAGTTTRFYARARVRPAARGFEASGRTGPRRCASRRWQQRTPLAIFSTFRSLRLQTPTLRRCGAYCLGVYQADRLRPLRAHWASRTTRYGNARFAPRRCCASYRRPRYCSHGCSGADPG